MSEVFSVFNKNNTEWKDGGGSLLLGQPSALLDSINRKHPELFNLYKAQKEADWSEDEIDLEQARLDFLSCPKDIYGAMIKNLSYQWEIDSAAFNSLAYVMAPFVTDSDFKLAITKNCEIEGTHSLTYSEIARLAVPDPEEVMREVMENDRIMDRADTVIKMIDQLQVAGAQYSLGMVKNDQELYNKAFMGLLTFYCLERLQFMASFAHTFAIVDVGYFQPVGKLVQKIMQDEFYYHCRTMEYAIKKEMKTQRGVVAYMQCKEDIESLLNDVVAREYDWNKYIFSQHSIPGVNEDIMNDWVNYNAQEVFKVMGVDLPFKEQTKNPLKFMGDWLDLDKFQNAQQEGDGNNYSLNSFVNDLPDDLVYDFTPVSLSGEEEEGIITVYTKSDCPFCVKVKEFLVGQGTGFFEIMVGDEEKAMLKEKGLSTVPQLFSDTGGYLGDCTSYINDNS